MLPSQMAISLVCYVLFHALQQGAACKGPGENCTTFEQCCSPKEAGAPAEYKFVKCRFYGGYQTGLPQKPGMCEYVKVDERWDYVEMGTGECTDYDECSDNPRKCCLGFKCYKKGSTGHDKVTRCRGDRFWSKSGAIQELRQILGGSYFHHNAGNLPWKPKA